MQLLGNLTLPAAAPQPGLFVRIEAPAQVELLHEMNCLNWCQLRSVQAKGKAMVLCDTNSSIRI